MASPIRIRSAYAKTAAAAAWEYRTAARNPSALGISPPQHRLGRSHLRPYVSGKSEELIRRLRRAIIARKQVQVFKPALDNRYSLEEIVTHANTRMESEIVSQAAEILQRFDRRTQGVGIDEANFFGPELVEVATRLADNGAQVVVAGLDTDFRGRPFAPIPDLLAVAESITKMLAICVRCGSPAKHTQRLVESEDLILVGASGAYEARCRQCFEPGIPKQEVLDFVTPGF